VENKMNIKTVEFRGMIFDATHGSPFDRGSADSWYSRPQDPHWYPEGTGNGKRIEPKDMSLAELRAYFAGYEYNEQFGGKKDYE
jgi:hypothetical protein